MTTRSAYRPSRMMLLKIVLASALVVHAPIAAAQTAPLAADVREYTILIYEGDAELASRTLPAMADAYWTAYDEFAAALAKGGVLRGGSALDEGTKATVRGAGGADEGVRHARLGGYFIIAARDLAEAKQWAMLAPPAAVAVEVRPHRPNPHMTR